MLFQELSEDIQLQLNREREQLKGKCINTPYLVHVYSPDGKRYFYARRCVKSWSNNKGRYMPFGGGSHWEVCYGAVQFQSYKNPLGYRDYRLCDGRTYKRSLNGTEIPRKVSTKKEVLGIAKQIGIFNI